MFSKTTIELSTNIPTPRASPPNEMILIVKPPKYINKKVVTMEIGIANPIMMVLLKFLKKRNKTKIASKPPKIAFR